METLLASLERLVEAVSALEGTEIQYRTAIELSEAIKQAKAAIAKAKGGA